VNNFKKFQRIFTIYILQYWIHDQLLAFLDMADKYVLQWWLMAM